MRAPQARWRSMAEEEFLSGFRAPIHRSIWNRILTWGAPRVWSGVWMLLCLMATGWTFVKLEGRLYLVPMVLWAIGQAILKALTRWDTQFDQVFKAKLRYRDYYEAG
jgi:type IV secretory pathway TrbD component